ncbi:hypothetical protein ACWGPW_24390 [Paenibacillus chitinolyticus]
MKKAIGFIFAIAMVFSVTTAAYADLGERPAPPIDKGPGPTIGTFDLGERP